MTEKVFTLRQEEIIELIKEGYVYKQIGDKLGISKGSVQCEVRIIIAKMRGKSTLDAILKAIREGIIPLHNRGV